MTEVECVWEEPAVLGEGPLWVECQGALYWLDIVGSRVYSLRVDDSKPGSPPGDSAKISWAMQRSVTSLAARLGGGLIGTVEDGFAFIDPATGTVDPIALPEIELPGNRFNDGKVDHEGRYWAGSMDREGRSPAGVLYRLDPDRSLHRMDDGYTISNGPAFSPDGTTLYHTDSVERVVYAFDRGADGGVTGKRPLIRLTAADEGEPDGMTVDSEGCLWLCHFGGARVTRYSADGEVLEVVPMPVPNVTSCTFGGPELDTLYITTARLHLDDEELDRYALSGSLFSCRPGVVGMPTPSFAG